MHELTPRYEVLEVRVVPSSTYTWTGGGVDSNWSTGANWQDGVAPTSASTLVLVFGSGKPQLTNIDNIPGLSVAEIELSGGYSISGDAITLAGSGGVGIDSQTGTNTFSDAITLGANLTFTQDAGQLNLGGVISGSQDLTKGGPGTLVLGGANTYTGTTTISAGTLQEGASNAIPSTSDVTDNGTLDLGGYSPTIGALSGSGTVTSSVAGSVTLTVGATNHSGTFSGVIQNGGGTVALTKTDTGTETLSGTNTYSGATIIDAGTLSISADANLGTAPGSAMNGSLIINGGTLAITGSFTLNANRGISLGTSGGTSGGTFDTASGTTLTYKGIAAGPGGLTKLDSGNPGTRRRQHLQRHHDH